MSYKYILNPEYENFKDALLNIKEIFHKSDASIHKARNELKIIDINGIKCVVKSFKVPHFVNRVAYTFFRDGKAKKSYLNAVKLEQLKVNTPAPIGVIEFFTKGLLEQSYFISLYEPYDFTIREVFHHKVENYQEILKQFAKFTYELHQKGVWHVDYSLGNILVTQTDEDYKFSLVDINRMEFKVIQGYDGLKNFNKFWAKDEDLDLIIKEYSKLANLDFTKAQKSAYRSVLKIKQKKKLKNYFKNQDENTK
jgi:serine/threonine protein kinase